jgi:lipopolysaccharide transport system ATP-binding protein
MGTVRLDGVGKAFKQYPTSWARLAEWIDPAGRPRHQLKWVLRNISFTVKPGEALGVIGVNGAGKSTLLKLITGTSQPTEGRVELTGRVSALLELGIGFHPEFTGRQNVMMAGLLLGLDQAEITAAMPAIEDFAEIGPYLDSPVRIYSSGMQVRLAFSIATARRPDILIVDEALSVGDAYFQHKSFDRIRQFREAGTTLLIVSHDKQAIQSVCDRAILLDAGQVAREGDPEAVFDYYNAMIGGRENSAIQEEHREDGKIQTISGSGEATVTDLKLLDKNGNTVVVVDVGSPVSLVIRVKVHAAIPRLVLGYMIKDRTGQVIFGTNTHLKDRALEHVLPGQLLEYRFSFPMNLGPGSYSIATALVSSDTHLDKNYQWIELALVFTVINMTHQHFIGCAWIDPVIEIEEQTGAT